MSQNIKYNTGVYSWENTETGHIYIGGAYKDLEKRRKTHRRDLKKGRHWIKHFQNAWNKYGEGCFEFTILERCPLNRVEEREQEYLDWAFKEFDEGRIKIYNECRKAGSRLGCKHTEETKQKMREHASKPEVKEKKRKTSKEVANRPEVKDLVSERMTKLWADKEWYDNTIRRMEEEAENNPERSAKISEKTKKQWLDEGFRAMMSQKSGERANTDKNKKIASERMKELRKRPDMIKMREERKGKKLSTDKRINILLRRTNKDGPIPDHMPELGKCWIYNCKQKYAPARRSWELFRSSISPGMMVLRRCNNYLCINPNHLFLGTALDRENDKRSMRSKGILPSQKCLPECNCERHKSYLDRQKGKDKNGLLYL